MAKAIAKTKVTIGVLTYNHEKYIEECLTSVVSQIGDFDLKVIIVNDRSKDNTGKIIEGFIERNSDINIKYVVNKTNMGAQKSIFKTLGLIKETRPNYWSYIEGDDKYLSVDRTQKHVDLLEADSTAIMSYNKLLLIDQKSQPITRHEPELLSEVLTTTQLAAQNHIGSFCATFYRAKCFDFFDHKEFDGLIVYDWFFNIWMSRFGPVKLLAEYLSGYRQHPSSVWSSMTQTDQYWELIWSIDSYNRKLGFVYDAAFQSYKRNIINQLFSIGSPMTVDIAILSERYISLQDRFLNGEIEYILGNNNNSLAIVPTKGSSDSTIKKYKQKLPNIANKIIGYDGAYFVRAKCIYATSTEDAYYRALPISRKDNSLLVFEICKDEEKTMRTVDTLRKLRAICGSVNFVKVVAHSEEIKQIIISNKLCDHERIAVIPSSVSVKIYGKDKMYKPAQLTSYYFQINNLLTRCVNGELKPITPPIWRRLIIRYHSQQLAVASRAKAMIKGNKFAFIMARSTLKLLRLIKRNWGVK